MRKSKLRLGEILIKEGLLTPSQLDESLKFQKVTGRPLGDIVVDKGYVSEKAMANTLAKQLGVEFVSSENGTLRPLKGHELEKFVPELFARQHMVLPLKKQHQTLTVALANPLDLLTVDNLKKISGCNINVVMAPRSDLREGIDTFYGQKDLLKEAVDSSYVPDEGFGPGRQLEEIEENLEDVVTRAEEVPVVKLVDLLLIQAIKERASDIHIEPFKATITVRLRVDGFLHKIAPPSQHLLPALIARIKILSNMDIAEKRLPQDGGFSVRVGGREVDLRVSVVPTVFGEKAVLRILDRGAISLDLETIGFNRDELVAFKECITRPYGLLFLTGPTGSGKTTTLYSALNYVKGPTKNIITVEDPVEYLLNGINQVQVKPKIGLTFASTLRAFLRQDPDIMMVGEVRDLETAEICVRAALTGHLVLSTLHTNDAPSAINRMVDIGVPNYLIASSLVLIVAQRLIRKLCTKCKEPVELSPELMKKYSIGKKEIFKPRGCEFCKQTGYSGRTAVHEMLVANEDIRELIIKSASTVQLRTAAKEIGMKGLMESGIDKVAEGITSMEEVMSIVFE